MPGDTCAGGSCSSPVTEEGPLLLLYASSEEETDALESKEATWCFKHPQRRNKMLEKAAGSSPWQRRHPSFAQSRLLPCQATCLEQRRCASSALEKNPLPLRLRKEAGGTRSPGPFRLVRFHTAQEKAKTGRRPGGSLGNPSYLDGSGGGPEPPYPSENLLG